MGGNVEAYYDALHEEEARERADPGQRARRERKLKEEEEQRVKKREELRATIKEKLQYLADEVSAPHLFGRGYAHDMNFMRIKLIDILTLTNEHDNIR